MSDTSPTGGSSEPFDPHAPTTAQVADDPAGVTASEAPSVQAGAAGGVGERTYGLLRSVPTVVLWALVALWTVPTAGVLVSSFRPGAEVRSTGWWTAFPDFLPHRFGRVVLLAGLILLVLVCVGVLVDRQRRTPSRDSAALALPVLAIAAAVATYPDMFAVWPMAGLTAVGVVAVVALAKGLAWGYDRLPRTARLIAGVAVAVAVVALVVGTAAELSWDNYRNVFDDSDMGSAFLNTVAIAVPATVIPITFAAFAAYAFAWMDFKGRYWLFIMVVAMLAVPFQMSLIPLYQLYNGGASLTVAGETIRLLPDLDMAGSVEAAWVTHIGFGLPLAIFLLHNYIASLPRDVFEAARIDGADHPTIFWRVVLPLSVPALAAFAIFQFLWVWNDYLVARTFATDAPPMTVELSDLAGPRGATWHLVPSAAFISIAVPLVLFFALQRYFVRGLLAGSVKG